MTWAEVCADPLLQSLPYRIETDRWGNIVISPPPRSRHGEYQFQIGYRLKTLLPEGVVLTECPVDTSEGTKAIDVAWVSRQRRDSKPNDPAYLIAPEICIEVLSPSNSPGEIALRKRLFFERGAEEFWLCDEQGRLSFFDVAGSIPQSKLCPDFPAKIEI